ncbi:tail fiber domain-containing protein [Tolypothrix sp. FACHB-123]|uniref:DUF6519 domain-containing protein n=1 Tax=Tolypothrix sp. FACHB-123 TaxID=2692868 RepID=UPI00168625AD|nr:DUF6519 domain-containing protein [Tolypothrix sp. FACHB-123]MBD2355996.1 tail fiber domain-containing protein [Tolypothrix sp. FACHB-123]
MKGDFTRLSFKPQKHYNGVWMQQGRLQLDADWNEQVDIQNYLHQSLGKNIIGVSGANKTAGNFKIDISDDNLNIAPGQIYVGGLLCELEKNITYKNQPDYPQPPEIKQESTYLVYLDVWERHVTALEDTAIREVALDSSVPDTTTRTKTVWQVKLLEIQLPAEYSYTAQKAAIGEDAISQIQTKRKAFTLAKLQELISKGDNQQKLLAVNFDNTAITGSPSSLDNQLYRVEIHNPGTLQTATFKWSRDNGIVVSPISKIDRNIITITNPGRDTAQSFAPNQWVEITDNERELKGETGILVRLMAGTSGSKLVFDPSSRVGEIPISAANFPLEKQPKVRRWDQNTNTGTISINQAGENSQWINIEAGIQVKFKGDNLNYQTGDYWLIPLRPNSPIKIELPFDEESKTFIPQPAQGIQHYYSPLAFYDSKDSYLEDYRDIFPLLVNCFDKTGGIMTGDLEIQSNLYVTGKQDDGKYIPGRVGIGTKAAEAKLHIKNASSLPATGKITTTENSLTVTGEGTVFQTELRVGDTITANGQTRIITKIISHQSLEVEQAFTPALTAESFSYQQPVIVKFTSGNQDTQLIVTDAGLIGIGTDTPQEKLHLNGAIRGNQLGALRISTGTGFVDIGPQNADVSHFVTDRNRYHFDKGITVKTGLIGSDKDTDLSLQTGDATHVTVSHDNGNVGIGIDKPEEKLHLNGAIKGNQSGALRISTGTGYVDIGPQDSEFSHFVTDRFRYHFDQGITVKNGLIGSDKDTDLSLQTAGETQVTVSNKNGNVGIGIDIPQEKLHLNGAIRGNQSGALRISTGTGFVDIGPQNANFTNFITDRPNYHFDKGITVKNGLISSDANSNLSLQTAGNTQVTLLQTNGNVGIGIANPEEKLHLAGTLRISDNNGFVNIAPQDDNWVHFTTDLDGYYFDKDIRVESGLITSLGNRDLSLQTSGTTHFKVSYDTGNVGVGVDQPLERLHISGAIRGNQSGALRINTGTGFVDIGPQDGNMVHFVTDRPSYHFDKTVTIAEGLRVTNNTSFVDIGLEDGNWVNFQSDRLAYHFDKPITISGGVISSFNNANLSLQTADKARMTLLQTNGNVGIGIEKPLARLHNQGAAPLTGQGLITSNVRTITGTGTTFTQDLNIGDIITVTNGATSQSRVVTNIAADGNSLTINTPFVPALTTETQFTYQQPITRLADSNGITQLIVTARGNVGIGTSHPDLDTKLHIQGNVRVNGDLFQDSSRELKDKITELSQQEVYEIIKALQPVKYIYKDDQEQKLHLGFIAENVPDILASPDKTAIQPFQILAVLAKAVKDQQAMITTLTNVVKEQQKQITALTEQNKNIDQKSWWG